MSGARDGSETSHDWRIFAEGRNCWRVAPARRAAVLVDGQSYFAALETALRRARRSIAIVGWAFDGRIRLRQDESADASPQLGDLLRSLVEERPELKVRILIWSTAVLHAPGAPAQLLLGADWLDHPRIRLKLDTQHPIYAAHHQKIVCIDDRVAFVGGIDLTIDRWDTCVHSVGDPHRRDPDGETYPPVHDIQMAVDGAAAQAIGEVTRQRWLRATDERIEPPRPARGDPWPPDLKPDFTDTHIAVARTAPALDAQPAVNEVAELTADALKAARRAIYIEAQYLTARYVGDILADHLRDPNGPEVVILVTHHSVGLVERFIMGANRDRLIRRLRQADREGRLFIAFPCIDSGEERQQILIHSKLIMVDDVFVRVGSSNLNNRSVGLDTECDLAIEARTAPERDAMAALRRRLLGEHLGADPDAVAQALEANGGSQIGAIESLNHGARRLHTFDDVASEGPTAPVFGTRILDPKRPFEPLWFLRRRLSRRKRTETL